MRQNTDRYTTVQKFGLMFIFNDYFKKYFIQKEYITWIKGKVIYKTISQKIPISNTGASQ